MGKVGMKYLSCTDRIVLQLLKVLLVGLILAMKFNTSESKTYTCQHDLRALTGCT